MENHSHDGLYNRVMIVDDTPVDRYIAKRNLEKSGLVNEIIAVESAQQAFNYLQANSGNPDLLPELIFLDIRMPEIDGFGFLEMYEKLPDSVKSKCIILMLTTSLSPYDLERAEGNAYIRDFLHKPLKADKLNSIYRNKSVA